MKLKMKTNFNATNCLHCLILSVINDSEISYFEMKCSIKKYYVVSQQKMLYVRHGFKISHRLLPLIHPAAELIRRI